MSDVQSGPKSAPLKSLSLPEFTQIAISLQSLVGAQLQDCIQTNSEVGLAFYHDRETIWLWFDLHPQRPMVIRVHGKPPPRKKVTRPLLLFIRSHFFGRRLESVRADLSQGRILKLGFHRLPSEDESEGVCEIEVRLFPGGQNVIARNGSKMIAERKPKDLPPSTPPPDAILDAGRTWEEIEADWWQIQQSKSKGVSAAVQDASAIEKEWKKSVDKKEKALVRMREELENKLRAATEYAEVGEWLKASGTIELPADAPGTWRELINPERSLSWNIEECFHRAKESARKTEGTRARLTEVEKELMDLKKKGPSAFQKRAEKEQKAEANNLLVKAEARGRRLKVAEDLEAYVGKSAADNMALLRRAQPFDYWLHLREQPGSHAILRRTRSRIVTDAEFAEAGRWVVEQSTGKRATELKGERFDLLIVECRFVRPIKGDKLGRVNYTNDRVMSLRL